MVTAVIDWREFLHFEQRPFGRERNVPVSQHILLSDKGPLLETLEFFAISHAINQPLNFLR